jgi:hypothetical protein
MKRILSKDELEKLPTPRLLAYKKSLPYPRRKYDTGFLDEKQLDKFNQENIIREKRIQEVKDILSKREHVPKRK